MTFNLTFLYLHHILGYDYYVTSCRRPICEDRFFVNLVNINYVRDMRIRAELIFEHEKLPFSCAKYCTLARVNPCSSDGNVTSK